jgi:hypothetical protein
MRKIQLAPISIAALLCLIVEAIVASAVLAQDSVPLTACAEVPRAAVDTTARRRSTRTDCNPNQARTLAILQSRINARDALEATCRRRISRAEAEAACTAHGKTLATTQVTGGLGNDAFSVPGAGDIDATLPAGSTRNARICVVLRDLKNQFESTTQGDVICVFDGFKRTIFTARSRAFCGVQCL